MNKANKEKLAVINSIITEYQKQGYVLTLRQLYYQLVSRDVIPNKTTEYQKLSVLLKEGRMAGVVDWSAIEDRLRRPEKPASFDSPADILNAAISQYALPRQNGQPVYIEVWVEKDALSGVLQRVTRPYHVPILVCRGYSSATAMHEAYKRFRDANENEQRTVILYLGDFDPSGEDMVRDIEERVQEFANGDEEANYGYGRPDFDFTIKKIALTKAQIKQYKPPPNPAKITDPRAAAYIAEHGVYSWEVDALKPEVLNALLDKNIVDLMDFPTYEKILEDEKADIKKLKSLNKYL